MYELTVSYVKPEFRSHLRIVQDEDGSWRWQATTGAKDQETQLKIDTAIDCASGISLAKLELQRQYATAGIDAAELAHLDHLK